MAPIEGAEHVSKAMPVNTDSAATAGVSAVGAPACAAGPAAAFPAAPGLVGAAKEVVGAGVAGVAGDGGDGDATAEARTRSTDELLAPHVASSSTPAATNCACLSWLTGSRPTRADNVPTVATCDVEAVAGWPSCRVAAGFSQMVSARPTACAGQLDCAPGDPRYSALRSRRTHSLGCNRRSITGQAAGTLTRTP